MSEDLAQYEPSPQELGEAMVSGILAGELERYEPPLNHYFADGLYGRQIFVRAGSCVVTCRHEKQHLTVALSGKCTVVDESGQRMEIEAPGVWVTEPGTQRSVYTHTDVIWLTVHATNLTDVDEIERVLVTDTLAEAKDLLLSDTKMVSELNRGES